MIPAICLDLTRTVRRIGRGPGTGIDRVEQAYLHGLLERETPLFGLVRSYWGHLLLDREGVRAMGALAAGEAALGPVDVAGRLARGLDPLRRRAEAEARRRAVARWAGPHPARLARSRLPEGTVYLNVGHSNLAAATLAGLSWRARIVVMLHDAIPLELPGAQRPGAARAFARKIAAVARHADLVICPSEAAAAEVARHLGAAAARPPALRVAPLGVPEPVPDPAALAARARPEPPYFVAVGTLEARKNTGLLLDLWEALAARGGPVPQLWLAGTRGWGDAALMRRLDALPADGPVREIPGLGDGALAALVAGSAGLLHPSRAEGFGYPPIEAALMGVPVVASNLAAIRETLGDIAVYADPDDMYQWMDPVAALARPGAGREQEQSGTRRPQRRTWTEHLNLVLSALG